MILLFPQTSTARSKIERRTTRSVSTQNDVYGCHIKGATLELRWTGPKTCERWNPYKNAEDENQPSLCAATRKADVSTKVGQSSLQWSRHIASTATTSCPRYCFMVTPLRHRLDCSVFCDRSLQCKHLLEIIDLCKARHDLGVVSFESVATCLRVVRACISLKIPFVSPTLSVRICGNSVDRKM